MEHVVFDGAQVMVGDPQKLQTKLSTIRGDGPSKLQVLFRLHCSSLVSFFWLEGCYVMILGSMKIMWLNNFGDLAMGFMLNLDDYEYIRLTLFKD